VSSRSLKTLICTSFAGNQQRFCEDVSSDRFNDEIGLVKGAQELTMALDDPHGLVTNDWEFVGDNCVVRSIAASGSVKQDTLEDDFILSTKLQPNDEVEVRQKTRFFLRKQCFYDFNGRHLYSVNRHVVRRNEAAVSTNCK